MPHGWPTPGVTPAQFDTAAARLLEAILFSHRSNRSFPLALNDAFAAALALLDADPLLADHLLDHRAGDADLWLRRASWQRTFADLLREEAAADPASRLSPHFLEPHLIAGIAWQLHRAHTHPGASFSSSRRSLLEFTLAYYLAREELRPAVDACLVSRRRPRLRFPSRRGRWRRTLP